MKPLLHYTDTETDEKKVFAHDPKQDEVYHAQHLRDIIATPTHKITDISSAALDIITKQIDLVLEGESPEDDPLVWDFSDWTQDEIETAESTLGALIDLWHDTDYDWDEDDYEKLHEIHWRLVEAVNDLYSRLY
jgi:hypothetical protein